MKSIRRLSLALAFAAVITGMLATTSCTSKTTTLPDGSVVEERGIDKDALSAGVGLGHAVIDRRSGK